MKNIITLLISMLAITATGFSQAEDSYTLKMNGKVVYRGKPGEDNTISVKARKFRKNTKFTFTYKTAETDNTWNRTLLINDEQDQEIKRFRMLNQSGSITIKGSAINPLIKKKQTLTVYTTSLPKDKMKAAAIRIRRIMLCKIELI